MGCFWLTGTLASLSEPGPCTCSCANAGKARTRTSSGKRMGNLDSGVRRGIGHVRFREALSPEPARIAAAAGAPLEVGVIARMGEPIRNPQPGPESDDLGLGELQEGRVHRVPRTAFNRRRGGDVGERLEGPHE